jgi:antitoxin VapB
VGETKTAKLFTHGRSQAARLPKEFRLPGKEVRVTRVGHRVILEPTARSPDGRRRGFRRDRSALGERTLPRRPASGRSARRASQARLL